MNDTSILDLTLLRRDALLNTLLYLIGDYNSGVRNGQRVSAIVEDIDERLSDTVLSMIRAGETREGALRACRDDLRKVTLLRAAVEADAALGKLLLTDYTLRMTNPATGQPYAAGGLNACAFQDDLLAPTAVTLVFRGTGAREWFDNGIGLSGSSVGTAQQREAAAWFDHLAEKNRWFETRPRIHLTGHSKGGNKVQYVTMAARYAPLIAEGYSLDGQCLSQEAIAFLAARLGEKEFDRRRARLYSIAADNDYVNILGSNDVRGRIMPEEHIFYLASNLKGMRWHYPDCCLNEDGTLTAFAEQGRISRFLQGTSEILMELPAPLRVIITEGAMGLAQLFLGEGEPLNGEKLSYGDILASVRLLLGLLPAGALETLENELGIDLDWLEYAVTTFDLIFFAPITLVMGGLGSLIDFAEKAAERLRVLGEKAAALTAAMLARIRAALESVKEWFTQPEREAAFA